MEIDTYKTEMADGTQSLPSLGGGGSAVDFIRDLGKRVHETTRKPHCCELQRGNVAAVPSMKIKELIVAGE